MQPIKRQEEVALHHGTFSDFIQSYINMISSGMILTDKGARYSEPTIRSYVMLLNNFKSYEISREISYTTMEISYDIAEDFQRYLVTETDNSKNTVGVILAKMKAVLAYALRKGFSYWGGSKFKISKETSTQTYLSVEEILKMRNAELTEGEERILDIQIIQAFTGMRNSTLKKFLKHPLNYIYEYQGKSYIDITEDKTDKQSIIPLGDIVVDILKKYDGQIKVPSQQYINKKIKVIAMKSGLVNNIVVRKEVNGVMNETLLPKFKKISTHTSRRTLISLMTQSGFKPSEIMPISGHATEAQMNKYVKLSNISKVQHLFGNDFFNSTLEKEKEPEK